MTARKRRAGAPLAVIGVPSQGAGRACEVARGPGALRAAGLLAALSERHDVIDCGDVGLPRPCATRDRISGLVNPVGMSAMIRAVAEPVARARAAGRFPLVVGGDCALLLGCLLGVAAGARALLHVDGHEDAYLPQESATGAWADCELAFALGRTRFDWDTDLSARQPLLAPEALAVLGARDHVEVVAYGARPLTAPSLVIADAELGQDPAGHTRRALAALAAIAPNAIWWHLDWDVLAAEAMPAIIHPAPGGLTWTQLRSLSVEAIADSHVVGWSIATFNPDLDPDGSQSLRIVEFVAEACARIPGATVRHDHA